ncbi:MAG: DUF2793 domain-containing protein [Janthinobacterium lividum]
MAETTGRYLLPLLQSGQAQKEVTHNQAVAGVDALLHLAVASRTHAAPPAGPQAPAAWIVGAAATGIWSGRAGELALFDDAGWSYVAPRDGCLAYVRDEGVFAVYAEGNWLDDAWPAKGLLIGGRRLLSAEPTAILQVSGGSVVDVQARATIAAMLNALQTMGLVATL